LVLVGGQPPGRLPLGPTAWSGRVAYGELCYGAAKSRYAEESRARLNRLVELIPARPLPPEVGPAYGSVRANLEQSGPPIGANDLWIAAHALVENLTLVGSSTREFARIGGLLFENWAGEDESS